MRLRGLRSLFWGAVFIAASRHPPRGGPAPDFDALIRGGTVYDGMGGEPYAADVGLRGDRIAAIGPLTRATAREAFDASGLAVAPGFINSLSWATESLIADPRSESDLRQGVTLEVFGEGVSMGPLTATMRRELAARKNAYRFDIDWTTLGEYLEFLERRGLVTNVASLVGATTVRVHQLGYSHRAPSPRELARMADLVREAMEEGALGVGSALIYAPAAYATRVELEALALAAAEYGGGYWSHVRSESSGLLPAIDEVIDIARATRRHAEIYHLKAAGRDHWGDLEAAIGRIEAARAEGLDVSANMYPFTAAASGLDAAMPHWVQEGGHRAWIARLKDPELRARILGEIRAPRGAFESLYQAAGGPENVLLLGFRSDALRRYTGRTLADVARERAVAPEEALLDLVAEDASRVTAAYFMMSEENVRRQLTLPWMTLGSDEESLAPRGVFLEHRPHPRAYGTFARFLGHYVRDEQLVPLPEAIRRLTSLPAANFGLPDRGRIAPDYAADLVVFDPARIADHATFENPHRFATGVEHVFVNGLCVLRHGEITGARPGRIVRGPGWRGARGDGAAMQDWPRAAG
jgi:N-acyl-D-amino-acid deacylase